MRPSALRQRLSEGLLDFAWDEWAQMGVLASPRRRSPWAQDPEALIVFTLEIGRDDPRLFDEMLDWIAANEQLLSTWRLRAMCGDPDDRRLVEATLDWAARSTGRTRRTSPVERDHAARPEPLFRGLSGRVQDPDPAFAVQGLLRPFTRPAGTARAPDMRLPANLAFRLRQLLGVGVRAEIVRCLLTATADAVSAQSLTRTAGFSGRNVREALLALHDAGVVDLLGGGREQRYALNRESWMRLLAIDPGELPTQREWPQLLKGLRILLRWLSVPDLDDLSEYLLGSQAAELLDRVSDDFKQAGIPVSRVVAAEAWRAVEGLVDGALRVLGVAHDLKPAPKRAAPFQSSSGQLSVYGDGSGHFRWRLLDADHESIAQSAESFASHANALQAAEGFTRSAESWRYEIYLDTGGGCRWRAKASNGETIAVSAEVFADSLVADRAVASLRELLLA